MNQKRSLLSAVIAYSLISGPSALWAQESNSARQSSPKSKANSGQRIGTANQKNGGSNSQRAAANATPKVGKPAKVSQPIVIEDDLVESNGQSTLSPTRLNRTVQAAHLQSNGSSQVEPASCKNCAPTVIATQDPIVGGGSAGEEGESVYETGLGADLADPSEFQLSATGCDACEFQRPNGISIQFHPMSPIGFLLSHSQLRVEAASYWSNGYRLPRLITTDGLAVNPASTALFGGGDVLTNTLQGVRGEYRLDFDACSSRGVLLRFFDTDTISDGFQSTSTSHPTVSRVFNRTTLAGSTPSTVAINVAGTVSGSSNAFINSTVYGGDILYRTTLGYDQFAKYELLAGYQQTRLEEQLQIASESTTLPLPGTNISITDTFRTSNLFHGAALGLNTHMRGQRWSMHGLVKLGIGDMQRRVVIEGSTTTTNPFPVNANTTTNRTAEGLLARNTNSGDYQFNTFVVSPETALTLGYRLSKNLEATLTYTYLCMPKVARVGRQLDSNLESNVDNIAGAAAAPRFNLSESSYNLHSLSYGLQWRY